MRKLQNLRGVLVAMSAAGVLFGAIAGPSLAASDADAIEMGKQLAFDRTKGNCMACHLISGASLPGNVGPPLIAMKSRFPDEAALKAQIWDATVKNPQSMMPPFGKHGVLSSKELDLIVEFLYTL